MEVAPKKLVGSAHGLACAVAQGRLHCCDYTKYPSETKPQVERRCVYYILVHPQELRGVYSQTVMCLINNTSIMNSDRHLCTSS